MREVVCPATLSCGFVGARERVRMCEMRMQVLACAEVLAKCWTDKEEKGRTRRPPLAVSLSLALFRPDDNNNDDALVFCGFEV
jgi:hypothetical protein